ncbi:MAG: ATP-binding protein, partial [Candidatus Sulfotelmatobacter sp.]
NSLSCENVAVVAAEVERVVAGYLLEEIPKAIEQTLEGVTRVSQLVSAMKEFSHPGTKEKTPLDLNHAIQSTITVARNEWKYVADVETEFDPSLPLVSCQPGEFNQVILNLIVNAAHAIAEVVGKNGSQKGKIKVQTRDCQEWVEIRIQDTGSGIPEKARARIFDPFFTTKKIGKGTGQGLAIARSVVVDKHDGSIHFETEEGKGTTFIIRLPYDGKVLAAKAASL